MFVFQVSVHNSLPFITQKLYFTPACVKEPSPDVATELRRATQLCRTNRNITSTKSDCVYIDLNVHALIGYIAYILNMIKSRIRLISRILKSI